MKGMSSFKTLAALVFLSHFLFLETDGQVVINEINLVTGPESGQFVELFGPPNAPLTGHSLVLVKSVLSGGALVRWWKPWWTLNFSPWTDLGSF